MLAEERQNQIVALVNAHRSMSVTDIQQVLDVSRETVRRDLLVLEQGRKLRRTYGGALALDTTEPELALRHVINAEGKGAIGQLAAQVVPDGATIMLGGGTTVQNVSEALSVRRNLTVVTNCVTSSLKLGGRNGNRVHLLGGELQSQNQTTLGRDTSDMLSGYSAEFAVIGAGGISPDGYILDYTREEAELYRLMVHSARTTILVADRSKFGRIVPFRIESLEKAAYLVTDVEPEGEMAKTLASLPVRVLVARTSS